MNLIVFFVLILLAVVFAEIELDGDVLVLTDENFDEAMSKYDSILVEFYAPWCGHCKTLAPEWSKAATALKSVSTKLAKLDATENTEQAKIHGIRGFPTIKYFRGGKYHSDYQSGRKEADIVAFALKKSSPALTEIKSLADLEKYESEHKVFAIALFDSIQSKSAKLFEAFANRDDTTSYAYSESADVKEKYGVTKDTVVIIKDFDEKRADVEFDENNFEKVGAFIVGNSVPLIQEFSAETSKAIFGSPITSHALFFTDKSSEHHSITTEALRPFAVENRGKILFVNVPITETRITEFFGVSPASLPALILVDMSGEKMKKFLFAGSPASPEGLGEFIDAFLNGELRPSLKSEDVQPDDQDGPVVTLRGFSFDDIVINNSKDVFVEFYAPWCGHCKKLAPVWDELGEKYQSNSNVVIAKIDATANEIDHPNIDVKGFPSLYFFKGSDKANPVKYEGARELNELVSFLEENIEGANKSVHDEF